MGFEVCFGCFAAIGAGDWFGKDAGFVSGEFWVGLGLTLGLQAVCVGRRVRGFVCERLGLGQGVKGGKPAKSQGKFQTTSLQHPGFSASKPLSHPNAPKTT